VSNQHVTDEIILAGFASLQQAMAEGFDKVNARIDALERTMDDRFVALEHRMMRRFDERDERLDDHERRIAAVEARP
jgi:hypothetical protein